MKTSKTVTVTIIIIKLVVYTEAASQCNCCDDVLTLTTKL